MLIRKLKGYIKKLTKLANKEIPITNSTRLSLALNYFIFYYEIKGLKEEAYSKAIKVFDESMKVLDDLEKSIVKDTLLIIHYSITQRKFNFMD